MAWRIIDAHGEVWHVQPAAERRANAELWQLMLAFRAVNSNRDRPALWAAYPLEAVSKSSLFNQADRIPDDALRDVLVEHLP